MSGDIKGGLLAGSKARKATLHAVVTRADGRVENLGMISYYHRFAPLRWIVNLWIKAKRKLS